MGWYKARPGVNEQEIRDAFGAVSGYQIYRLQTGLWVRISSTCAHAAMFFFGERLFEQRRQ
jgi:hypothetical protein